MCFLVVVVTLSSSIQRILCLNLCREIKIFTQPTKGEDCRTEVRFASFHENMYSRFKRHIDYCMDMISLLRNNGVNPLIVFDGATVPMKEKEAAKRASERDSNFKKAEELWNNGETNAAKSNYRSAARVTPKLVNGIIQVLKQEGVEYIVAPYEADAQLTFLLINQVIQAIISNDSDFIAHGCSRVFYQMKTSGKCMEFLYSSLGNHGKFDLKGFTKEMFLEACVFAGSDYLDALPNFDLGRACKEIAKFRSYKQVIQHLPAKIVMPEGYEELFKKALMTFRHQLIYDPSVGELVNMTILPPEYAGEDLNFLGKPLSSDEAKGVATGEIDSWTLKPFETRSLPSPSARAHVSSSATVLEAKFEAVAIQENQIAVLSHARIGDQTFGSATCLSPSDKNENSK